MRNLIAISAVVTMASASASLAGPARHPQAEEQALDLAEKAIALRSVRGPGNQAPEVAALFRSGLIAGGFADRDVTIAAVDDTGHALNALPQRATANVNCRIFPGHTLAEIMSELKTAAAEPAVELTDVSQGSVMTDASPIRPDLVAAVTKAIRLNYPGIPVFPTMAAGASDSMWFRHLNVSSYGVSPLFIKVTDRFSHGLNERAPIANIARRSRIFCRYLRICRSRAAL